MDTEQAKNYQDSNPERKGLWIHTNSGKQFYAFDPHPDDIDIGDIAQGLALTCRYSGQCDDFYSVAQHSVIVSYLVPKEYALAGLLHDAPEAYITDIPRPIKHMLNENNNMFSNMEAAIYKAIAQKFGIQETVPDEVHAIDYHIVADEANVLFTPPPEWSKWYEPLGVEIKPFWEWSLAKEIFLKRFMELHYAEKS